jgi:hypothetical protein
VRGWVRTGRLFIPTADAAFVIPLAFVDWRCGRTLVRPEQNVSPPFSRTDTHWRRTLQSLRQWS